MGWFRQRFKSNLELGYTLPFRKRAAHHSPLGLARASPRFSFRGHVDVVTYFLGNSCLGLAYGTHVSR